ncbi:MAG TPA: prepilin-type cleavage/methylation domain-containing protein [Chromatiales bacterium]|nr:prepilin-type cleavage/methylation domain-containing protein [Chromatiales bacterium]
MNPLVSNGQRGISLVELMVAMVLGLVVVGGVVQIYVSNKQTYRVNAAVARIQENARFALDLLGRDLRAAGYWGCGGAAAQIANAVNGTGWQFQAEPIHGYEGGVDTFPSEYASTVLGNSDSFRIAYMDANSAATVTSHASGSASFTTASVHDFEQGEILAVVSTACGQAGIFQMSNSSTTTVEHKTSVPPSPGNCITNLGGAFICSNTGTSSSYTYENGSRLMRFVSRAYYIRNGASGEPALWRAYLTHSGTTAAVSSEELVEGVEDMQVLYGLDTDADGTANSYVKADAVGTWDDVVSVRVDLLMRSVEDNLTSDNVPYELQGASTTPADKRIRRVFTTVVALRNRVS